MDPNCPSFIDKIVQNPQNWISFMGLAYTILIVPITIIAAWWGISTSKKFSDMQKDYSNVKEKTLKEVTKLEGVKNECDRMIERANKLIDQMNVDPDLNKRRELLDSCLSRLKSQKIIPTSVFSSLSIAMLFTSEKGNAADLTKIINIFTIATDSKQTDLAAIAYQALKRLGSKL